MPFSEIQSSELFVELSEEQQETAGGFDFGISLTILTKHRVRDV